MYLKPPVYPVSRTQKLSELFGLGEERVLALVGAGGKTTTMFALAHELAGRGWRVAVSTTTHIFCPDARQCPAVVTDGDPKKIAAALRETRLVTVGVPCADGKLSAPADEQLRYLQEAADYLLLESDGSRGLPIKAPNESEPVLYAGTEKIIAVGGLSCLGKPLEQVCHRAPLAQALLGVESGHLLTARDVAQLLYRCYGRLEPPPVVSLNQADSDGLCVRAGEIAAELLPLGVCRVAVTSFLLKQFAYYTCEQSGEGIKNKGEKSG